MLRNFCCMNLVWKRKSKMKRIIVEDVFSCARFKAVNRIQLEWLNSRNEHDRMKCLQFVGNLKWKQSKLRQKPRRENTHPDPLKEQSSSGHQIKHRDTLRLKILPCLGNWKNAYEIWVLFYAHKFRSLSHLIIWLSAPIIWPAWVSWQQAAPPSSLHRPSLAIPEVRMRNYLERTEWKGYFVI